MHRARIAELLIACATTLACATPKSTTQVPRAARSVAEVLAGASKDDWQEIASATLLVMELPKGRVLIELAPDFAPMHVANIARMAHDGYFDGLAVVRAQDNYVVQWGDPSAEDAGAKSLGDAASKLPAEFFATTESPITALVDGDTYAPETGFFRGFPVAQDRSRGERWLPHCYSMVGAGRNEAADTSNGAELYVVIGQAPRHLDRNMTMVGRVVSGIELLSTLPRGTGPLGFYARPEERTPLTRVRIASDYPADTRPRLERLRTDTATFRAYLDARRSRREPFFVEPLGRLDVCNVQVPVRAPVP